MSNDALFALAVDGTPVVGEVIVHRHPAAAGYFWVEVDGQRVGDLRGQDGLGWDAGKPGLLGMTKHPTKDAAVAWILAGAS